MPKRKGILVWSYGMSYCIDKNSEGEVEMR